jgi:hypothetical protein
MMIQQGQAELLEIVLALCPSGRLSGRLHRRQKQGNQNPNDRNDHQQFHQREPICRPAECPWDSILSVDGGGETNRPPAGFFWASVPSRDGAVEIFGASAQAQIEPL